jgi:uncharacterized protein (TIGR02145 family)
MKRLILFTILLLFFVACDKDPNPPLAPTITTGNAGNVENTTATVSLSITDVSKTKEMGVLYSRSSSGLTSINAQKGSIKNFISGDNSVSLTGLLPGTTYYYMAFTSDGYGFIYGAINNFTTGIDYPILTTNSVTNISSTHAICGGTIANNGGGNITACGVCWSTSNYPTIGLSTKTIDGNGTVSFSSNITGLQPETTFYVRAYATNQKGTAYGSQMSFTTTIALPASGSVSDIDGNVYHFITIGTQVWMVENLKTTRYRNGATIPNVTDNASWAALSTGALCDCDNAPSNSITYGKLYNWYAINDSRNIAPIGWHVPSDAEWTTLTTYLGGESIAGGKLKEIGTAHWPSPNTGATNSSGFTALPGGYRYSNGTFDYAAILGEWWSSTEYTATYPFFRYLSFADTKVGVSTNNKLCGLSIRCIRDY